MGKYGWKCPEENPDCYLHEALGIDYERANEIIDYIMNLAHKYSTKSEALDEIWSNSELTFEEKVFATYELAILFANPISMIIYHKALEHMFRPKS